jgi:glycosyltransferase involved in cell wall biosynthesis
MTQKKQPSLLIFIVAYQAETTIADVVQRIPATLLEEYDVDILIIDDSSRDQTFEKSHAISKTTGLPFKVIVLFNPVNQGYGGNQKLGYRYAIDYEYDFVALLHGDGQYAPECLPDLLQPLLRRQAAAVFGSRMIRPKDARRGGMPLYKYVGNKILTYVQNRLLRSHLSEFHSGYRIYSVQALKKIPFERNSNDFHFDTEIIIQLMIAKLPIVERPIPTYYGDEICRVNGVVYAANCLLACLRARLQELTLFYDRRYDCAPVYVSQYSPKFTFESPHSYTLRLIPENSKVIDLGCADGHVAAVLKEQKGCYVAGVDVSSVPQRTLDKFYLRDLNDGVTDIPVEEYDFVLLLDVLEHLVKPEAFLDRLRERLSLNPNAELIVSTGNVAFIITRLMLLFGQFNYGKKGILDLTHTRLFTFASLVRALQQAGFTIVQTGAMPAPFDLAVKKNLISNSLSALNSFLNRLLPTLFAYQVIVRAKARPSVESLLRAAQEASRARASALEIELR